jgi:hypothetical protein
MYADLERWVRIPDSLQVSSWIRPRAELSSAVAGSAALRARRRRFRSVGLAACEQQQMSVSALFEALMIALFDGSRSGSGIRLRRSGMGIGYQRAMT